MKNSNFFEEKEYIIGISRFKNLLIKRIINAKIILVCFNVLSKKYLWEINSPDFIIPRLTFFEKTIYLTVNRKLYMIGEEDGQIHFIDNNVTYCDEKIYITRDYKQNNPKENLILTVCHKSSTKEMKWSIKTYSLSRFFRFGNILVTWTYGTKSKIYIAAYSVENGEKKWELDLQPFFNLLEDMKIPKNSIFLKGIKKGKGSIEKVLCFNDVIVILLSGGKENLIGIDKVSGTVVWRKKLSVPGLYQNDKGIFFLDIIRDYHLKELECKNCDTREILKIPRENTWDRRFGNGLQVQEETFSYIEEEGRAIIIWDLNSGRLKNKFSIKGNKDNYIEKYFFIEKQIIINDGEGRIYNFEL